MNVTAAGPAYRGPARPAGLPAATQGTRHRSAPAQNTCTGQPQGRRRPQLRTSNFGCMRPAHQQPSLRAAGLSRNEASEREALHEVADLGAAVPRRGGRPGWLAARGFVVGATGCRYVEPVVDRGEGWEAEDGL